MRYLLILLSLPLLWYEQRLFFENGQIVDGCAPKPTLHLKREKKVKARVVKGKTD